MARYSQKFRDLLNAVPKPDDTKGFTPEMASVALTHTINKALQVIQELEESLLDAEEEITKLQSQLITGSPTEDTLEQTLKRSKSEEEAMKDSVAAMLESILGSKKEKDKKDDV